MPSVNSIMTDILTLKNEDQLQLFDLIGEAIILGLISKSIYNNSSEQKFADGVVCIHCGSMDVIKHGKKNEAQRFKYKDCGRTFNGLTLSALSNSKLNTNIWLNYEKCMVLGFSTRKFAEIVNVSVKTSFYMRHRILDAIKNYQGIGHVSGIVEMDETFVPESFKGNQKKSGFIMSCPNRKRSKQVLAKSKFVSPQPLIGGITLSLRW